MMLLPVALNVQGKRALVVGGGAVAARKVLSLLQCEAQVSLIAPHLNDELEAMRSQFAWVERVWQSGDCNDFLLVFACTNSREANAQIAGEAREQNIWCNIADDAANSDFHGAAAIRRGEICIGITTSGGSPALSRHLKREVEGCVGDEYAQLLELMSRRRAQLESRVSVQSERAALWRAVLNSDVLSLLRNRERAAAEQRVDELLAGV
jgi:precorrin-2 dehydrogenase/sirohydrochlorin ferrochelatase